jgi:hypothetical protein
MVYHLAELAISRFREAVHGAGSTLGLGIVVRQAREVVRFIPWVGSVAGSAGGRPRCAGQGVLLRYSAIHQGHAGRGTEKYYGQQLAGQAAWRKMVEMTPDNSLNEST